VIIPAAGDLQGRTLTIVSELGDQNPRRPYTHGWLAFEVLRKAPGGTLRFEEYARRLFYPDADIAGLAKEIPGQPNAYQDFRHIRCDIFRGVVEVEPPLADEWYLVERCSKGTQTPRARSLRKAIPSKRDTSKSSIEEEIRHENRSGGQVSVPPDASVEVLSSPDDVKELIAREFPELIPARRHNPDGWSFYIGHTRGGAPSRIARVVQAGRGRPLNFKPAVSARLSGNKRLEFPVTKAEQVRELIQAEITLWSENRGTVAEVSERPASRVPVVAPAAPPPSLGSVHATPVDQRKDSGQNPPYGNWIRYAEIVMGILAFVLVAYWIMVALDR
jgi:hypothetical protein